MLWKQDPEVVIIPLCTNSSPVSSDLYLLRLRTYWVLWIWKKSSCRSSSIFTLFLVLSEIHDWVECTSVESMFSLLATPAELSILEWLYLRRFWEIVAGKYKTWSAISNDDITINLREFFHIHSHFHLPVSKHLHLWPGFFSQISRDAQFSAMILMDISRCT